MDEREANMSAEAHELYRQLRDAGVDIPRRDEIEQYRARVRAGFEPYILDALARFDGDIDEIEIDGLPCRQLTPSGWSEDRGICIQYAYGGGYVSGSTFEDQVLACDLARHAGARVVMIEYRLSPEHPYPLPQQDMRGLYPALLERYGAGRLVVSGESAGGNQAVGLLQHIRDAELPMPRCAALFSPWCDLTNQGDSHAFNDSRDPTLNTAWTDLAASWHANGEPLDNPGISPLFGDMQGLPPCIITSGSRDLLLSQCLLLAQRLRQAGVECDLRVWDGLWHVFEFYPIPEADQSIREVAAFIEAHC